MRQIRMRLPIRRRAFAHEKLLRALLSLEVVLRGKWVLGLVPEEGVREACLKDRRGSRYNLAHQASLLRDRRSLRVDAVNQVVRPRRGPLASVGGGAIGLSATDSYGTKPEANVTEPCSLSGGGDWSGRLPDHGKIA